LYVENPFCQRVCASPNNRYRPQSEENSVFDSILGTIDSKRFRSQAVANSCAVCSSDPFRYQRDFMAHSSPYLDDVEDPQDEDLKLISRRKSPKDGAQPQSPLETYLREINETKLLTAEDEQMLARQIAVGDVQARDRMVRANLRLLVNIARSYVSKGLALQDLIEEGNLGLLRAVEGFDPDMGTRFSTYASYWIKQSIKRALINSSKTIRIPAYMVELLSKWRRATASGSQIHKECFRWLHAGGTTTEGYRAVATSTLNSYTWFESDCQRKLFTIT
jgi:RNA polymerase sigma factor (sigma-70 family)